MLCQGCTCTQAQVQASKYVHTNTHKIIFKCKLVQCLPNVRGPPWSIPTPHTPPGCRGVEARAWQVQGHLLLHSKSEAISQNKNISKEILKLDHVWGERRSLWGVRKFSTIKTGKHRSEQLWGRSLLPRDLWFQPQNPHRRTEPHPSAVLWIHMRLSTHTKFYKAEVLPPERLS